MDYSTPLRVAISTPGNDGATVEPISPPSDSRNPPVSNIGASHLRTGLPRPTPELLSTDHLTGHGHSQSHIMSTANASNSHIMDPLSVGIPHGSRRVVPRPVAGDPTNETTPLPGSLASPVRNKAMSPAPSPISNPSGSKSTNFHNIADLIGGSKSHRNQFPLEGKSPELSQCIKEQTTPTSNPRLGKTT